MNTKSLLFVTLFGLIFLSGVICQDSSEETQDGQGGIIGGVESMIGTIRFNLVNVLNQPNLFLYQVLTYLNSALDMAPSTTNKTMTQIGKLLKMGPSDVNQMIYMVEGWISQGNKMVGTMGSRLQSTQVTMNYCIGSSKNNPVYKNVKSIAQCAEKQLINPINRINSITSKLQKTIGQSITHMQTLQNEGGYIKFATNMIGELRNLAPILIAVTELGAGLGTTGPNLGICVTEVTAVAPVHMVQFVVEFANCMAS